MMIKRKFSGVLAAVVIFLVIFGASFSAIQAQQTFTEQDAINLAAESAEFKDGLANVPGWTAAAYDTGNRYGIWRVQFWNGAGEELGWADVSPARGRVYTWEAYFPASDAQTNMAQTILRDYLNTHPQVLELIEDPAQHEIYVEYDAWNRWWGAYIDVGIDSLYFVVRFGEGGTDHFTDPKLVRLYFANVMTYSEWQEATKAQVVAKAFQQPEISAALSGIDGWTTSAEKDEDGLWTVSFMDGESQIAWVKVDLSSESVVEFNVGG